MTPIDDLIQQAKREGYAVYAPEKLTSYFYIVSGDAIGYCQYNNFKGASFSTVHLPCSHAGTGYAAESMAGALMHRPSWASNDAPVIKYKNAADFLARHWQPLKQY